MLALWTRCAFDSLKALTSFKQWSSIVLPWLALLAINSVALAQGGASPVTKSFDFRNGSLGWEAGFSDYPPATDNGGFYQLKAEIRSLPPELGVSGTGFYIQGNDHADDLFMFLKRRLNSADGIVAGQTYQITFTLVFASSAQSGCVGAGGAPGEAVWLKAGASPAEPTAQLTPVSSDPRVSPHLRMNVDKSDQSQGGIAASVTGNIANGQACDLGSRPFVSLQRTHQHTSLVNASSRGELWLLVGTDSGFEALTALYYQRIDVSLVPVNQQQPVLLTYKDRAFNVTGRATALDSVALISEPFPVIATPTQNFSSDQRTRITLFAYYLELKAGEDLTAITAEAEDSQHVVYALPVEAAYEVPNFSWLTQVTVRLPDQLQGIGNVAVSVKLRGLASNKLPITIK
jgi:hypothetical protein